MSIPLADLRRSFKQSPRKLPNRGVDTVRGLIVGLGSIGKRHLRNVREMLPESEITLLRRPPGSGTELESKLADRVVCHLEEALDPLPDFAIIASPAPCHIETAIALARRGVHLLVEKPLSNRLEGVDELLEVCRHGQLVLLIGYTMRFHRSLQMVKRALDQGLVGKLLGIHAEVGQYLPDWRPSADYRTSVTARRELGGGALLELSHEIDYVRWLGGEVKSVQATSERLSELEIDVEDWAEVVMRFANGGVAQVHLDLVQRSAVRQGRAIGSEGTVQWELMTDRVQWYSSAKRTWSDLLPVGAANRNEMYQELLSHFFCCLRGEGSPAVTGEDARRVLEIVFAARESASSGRLIAL